MIKPPCMLLLILSLFQFSVQAQKNDVRLQHDVSLSDARRSEQSQICKGDLATKTIRKQGQDVTLIGQVRSTGAGDARSSAPDLIVQIIWTGIQAKDKKKRKVWFKSPLISTFKSSQPVLIQGTILEMVGDIQEIDRAVQALETDQLADSAQGMDNNPQSTERRVMASLQASGQTGQNMSEESTGETPETHRHAGHGAAEAQGSSLHNGGGHQDGSLSHSSHSSGSSWAGGGRNGRTRAGGSQPVQEGAQLVQTHSRNQAAGNPHPSTSTGQTTSASYADPATSTNVENSTGNEGIGHPSEKESVLQGQVGQKPFDVTHDAQQPVVLPAHHKLKVEITEKGCTPRIDFEKGQYIIQNRSITRRGGQIIEESPCSDSGIWYAIKKDYSVCSDDVDRSKRVAYTTFRRYWLDQAGKKHYLDQRCVRDESQPHPFLDDPQNCTHLTDLTTMQVWRQVETLYFNRKNARQVVRACHKTGDPLSIVETAKGCPLKHLFERHYSIIQKRSVFMDQGIEHTVVPCHESTDTVAHVFVRDDCKAVVTGTTAVPMAKRQIRLDGKTQLITSNCEPMATQDLIETTEGCEGQFYDDFNAGRSYQASRWYYLWKNKKQFVGSCQRSNKTYPHETHFLGYQNYDNLLKSKPRMLITVTVNGKTVPLRTLTEEDEKKFFPYTQAGTVSRSTGGDSSYIYYQAYTIWKRPDGSTYEQPGSTWSVNLPSDNHRLYDTGSSTSSW